MQEKPEFGEIYKEHYSRIHRFVRMKLGLEVADDITSEIFLKAYTSYHKFQDRGLPYIAYLKAAAKNFIVNFYRDSSRHHKEVSLNQAMKESKSIVPGKSQTIEEKIENPNVNFDPVASAENNFRANKIREAVGNLRPLQKQVIILRYFQELKIREIEKITGKSNGSIRALTHRALRSLKRNLRNEDF
jgi:RNA polymerase sigma-70 factor, ECF subfamily